MGQNFSGQVYLPAATNAPRTLLVKLPSADPQQRQLLFTLTHHYTREVKFFRDVADKTPIRVPRCYYSASIPDDYKSILLLEDLAPMRTLDSVQGCSPDMVALALGEVARLHAAWWQHRELTDLLP